MNTCGSEEVKEIWTGLGRINYVPNASFSLTSSQYLFFFPLGSITFLMVYLVLELCAGISFLLSENRDICTDICMALINVYSKL